METIQKFHHFYITTDFLLQHFSSCLVKEIIRDNMLHPYFYLFAYAANKCSVVDHLVGDNIVFNYLFSLQTCLG